MVYHRVQSLDLCYFSFILKRKHIISQYTCNHNFMRTNCQVYSSCKPDKKDELVKSTLICIEWLSQWIVSDRLKLNPNKTEFMWIATRERQHLIDHSSIVWQFPKYQELASIIYRLTIPKIPRISMTPSSTVRLLRVHIDEMMSFKAHIENVVSTCFIQLHQLQAIRNCIPPTQQKH